jgi:hypothetical protein
LLERKSAQWLQAPETARRLVGHATADTGTRSPPSVDGDEEPDFWVQPWWQIPF